MNSKKLAWSDAGAGYIPSLDGLRAVSILIVFVAHAGVTNLIPGGFGVTVFFFLSGYLITTLLCREHNRSGAINFKGFYLRRLVRLGPPLLLTLLLAFILVLLGLAAGDLDPTVFLAQIFFVYNYFALVSPTENAVDGLGILWSLAVEEHFYLIWPGLFVLIARQKIGWRHIGGLLVAILVWRCVRFAVLGSDEWAIYLSTDTRFDSLLYGCLLALMIARGSIPDWVKRPRIFYPALVVSAILLGVSFIWRDPLFRSTLRYTLQGIALMPVFYYAVQKSDHFMFRPLNFWVVRKVGIYSYTLYLVHLVILNALWRAGYPQDGVVAAAFAMILSIIWAALVFHLAEKPLHGLRARLNSPESRTTVTES